MGVFLLCVLVVALVVSWFSSWGGHDAVVHDAVVPRSHRSWVVSMGRCGRVEYVYMYGVWVRVGDLSIADRHELAQRFDVCINALYGEGCK